MSTPVARLPFLESRPGQRDFSVLAPLRRVLPLVVTAKEENQPVAERVTEDAYEEVIVAQTKLE